MPPVATIAHQVRGRMRLRIREKRQDHAYFEETCVCLEALPGIDQVLTNSNTGSIVILHELQDNDELQARIHKTGLFALTADTKPQAPAIEPLRSGLSDIGYLLREGSSGSVDLRTLAFLGMMGLTLHQIMRGQVLGPALPMLWNAFSLIGRVNNAQPEPGPDSNE